MAKCSSPKNMALMKSLGVEEVFDYVSLHPSIHIMNGAYTLLPPQRDHDLCNKIKHAAGNNLKHCFDTISSSDTITLCSKVMCQSGGELALVLAMDKKMHLRPEIKVYVNYAYCSLGQVRPQNPSHSRLFTTDIGVTRSPLNPPTAFARQTTISETLPRNLRRLRSR